MGMNDWLQPVAVAVAMTLPLLEAQAGVVAC